VSLGVIVEPDNGMGFGVGSGVGSRGRSPATRASRTLNRKKAPVLRPGL